MKVLRVHIRRGALGEPMMVYPARYDAQEVDRNGLGPLNVNKSGAYSGHIGRGGSEEWCIIVLSDGLAAEYAKDADMEIITPEAADALMEQWRMERGEPREFVSDADRLQAIQTKLAAKAAGHSIELSPDDLKALDPDDATPGINLRLKPIIEVCPGLKPAK